MDAEEIRAQCSYIDENRSDPKGKHCLNSVHKYIMKRDNNTCSNDAKLYLGNLLMQHHHSMLLLMPGPIV